MKRRLVFLIAFFALTTAVAQTDINDARLNFSVGQTVTITGVSSNGNQLGPIRYIQDVTGGLPVYGATINTVGRGDSVTVTGVLKDFNGLLEIDPISSWNGHGTGTQIAPWVIAISNMGEDFEGRLVQFDNITFPDAGGTFAGNTNYNFTDGTNTGQLRVYNGTNLVGTPIPAGPQTFVGLHSQFNATYQIIPRDANDIFPYAAPDKKIDVEINGISVLNNSTALIGTAGTTLLTIKNIGENNLTVSDFTITGPSSGDFAANIVPGAIAGFSQTNNEITFNAQGNGSRLATLSIESDDPDVPVFTLDLYAIGNDGLATEPTSGASALNFSNVKAYTLSASYSPAAAERYLVVWKEGSAPTSAPVDGTEYMRGDVVGDGKVAYVGAGTSFTPRGIRADIDYHFAVYAYNGFGNYVNYAQSQVLTGNVSSTGSNIGTYYNGISSLETTLVDDLTALINPHQFISYFLYKTIVMDQFEIRDTINGESFVECAYSGERLVFSGPFDWVATGYSREHTYAHSWMGTFPANNPEQPEYTDYHNLYPANLSKANIPRSNLPLGEITGNTVYNYLEGSVGYGPNGALLYEPRDANKGNAARALFYMAVTYNDEGGYSWQLPPNFNQSSMQQNQEVLKSWHFADLPDSYEIARHELIFDAQGNRNPFIDSVDFACFIDFSNMNYKSTGCELSLSQNELESNLIVFPNPASEIVYVQVNGQTIERVSITDMTGRQVYTSSASKKLVEVGTSELNAGTYIINVTTAEGAAQRKLIIQ